MLRIIMAMATAAVLLTGCQTMQGLGKDIQKAGNAVERAAK